ncbi:MAG: MCP four helix bundle domain-containing protein, partial [Fibrobacterota bacterium]
MFKNMKIAMKIGIGFAGVLLAVAALVLFTNSRLDRIDTVVDLVVQDRNVKVRQCYQLLDNLNVVSRALRNIALADDQDTRSKEAARVEGVRESQSSVLDSLSKSINSEDGQKLFAAITKARESYGPLQKKTLEVGLAGDQKATKALLFGDFR